MVTLKVFRINHVKYIFWIKKGKRCDRLAGGYFFEMPHYAVKFFLKIFKRLDFWCSRLERLFGEILGVIY